MINLWLLACLGLFGLAEVRACPTGPLTAACDASTPARCPIDPQAEPAAPRCAGLKDRPPVHSNCVRSVGIGYPPRHLKGARARLMARRAAEVVAVRNLARKLGYPRRATIRGFRYVSTEYLDTGSVRVIAEYPLGACRPPAATKKPGSHPGRRFPCRTVKGPVINSPDGSVRADQ